MILIWRGWGLLAVVTLFPLLSSCAGLIDVEPKWVFGLAALVSLLFAGTVCVYCGTRWNRHGTAHSFYFVPLQVWGWVYLAHLILVALIWVLGGIYRVIKPLPGKPPPGEPGPMLVAAAGGIVLFVVLTTAWLLTRSARPRSAEERPGTNAAGGGFDSEP